MKHLSLPTVLLAIAATSVSAQSSNASYVSFSDPGVELDIKLAIPDVSSAPFPLLVTFSAPVAVGWAGFATGGCMLRSPLIVAWPSGAGVVVGTWWATAFHSPSPYPNTTTSVVSSSVNVTHWSASVLCQKGCSDWLGGSIDPNYNNATFGYAASGHAPTTPADVNSAIKFHDLAIGHFDRDLTKAKNSQSQWAGLVKGS